jgi:hypothetical protein
MDVPLWLSILLYAIAAIATAMVLFLLMLYAMRQALREPLAELRTARRRQEDLLREIAGSVAYVADVVDVWAESEAERSAAAEERSAASERKAAAAAGEPADAQRAVFGPGSEHADEPSASRA